MATFLWRDGLIIVGHITLCMMETVTSLILVLLVSLQCAMTPLVDILPLLVFFTALTLLNKKRECTSGWNGGKL